ncbi:hypothetical protein JTB14_007179 [Gonioctena quinquepunctata]|nr:hypothetical protein JTB14_007179 [Gonioctena quinquepunctata]
MENLSSSSTIWDWTGTHQRMINVSKMHEKLGNSVCNALPGLLTGCDFNPAFYKKDSQSETSELDVSDHDSEINEIEDSDEELFDDNL